MKRFLAVTLFCILLISAICVRIFVMDCFKHKVPHVADAYALVIEKLFYEHKEPNFKSKWLKYIAIDTSTMVNLTYQSRIELLVWLKGYGYKVLEMTAEELKENGYMVNGYFKNGFLLRFNDQPYENNRITMEASRYSTSEGALGYRGIVLEYKDGEWSITNIGGMWMY